MGLLSSSNITTTMKFQVNLRRSAFCLPQNAETIMTVLCHQTYKLRAKDAKQAKQMKRRQVASSHDYTDLNDRDLVDEHMCDI